MDARVQGWHGGCHSAEYPKHLRHVMASPRVPTEIDEILRRYDARAGARPSERRVAEREAIQELEAVAIHIDAEQDHEYATLVEAAMARVRTGPDG